MSEAQKNPPVSNPDLWRPNWWTYTLVGFVVLVIGIVIGAFGVTVATQWFDKPAQPVAAAAPGPSASVQAAPQWWTTMHETLRADHWSVYDCAPRVPYPVPCPDYVASIEFRGDAKEKPPMLTKAFGTDGKLVIDLKAERKPAYCGGEGVGCFPESWDVTVTFGPDAQAFAYNDNFGGTWSGPRLFLPISVRTFGSVDAIRTVEIYAGNTGTYMRSAPLTLEKLGNN